MDNRPIEPADNDIHFEWADADPFDLYRRHLPDAVLEHGGPRVWLVLAEEMQMNP